MSGFGQSGDRCRREIGAKRNHHVIRGNIRSGYLYASVLRVNALDLALHDVDAGLLHTRKRA